MSKIIAFEGHNGVGKTTIAEYLGEKYGNKGCEHSYGVDERFLKSPLKKVFSCKTQAPWLPSFLYFLTGAMEEYRHISQEDKLYIFDRSFWSSLAAQWDQSEEAKQGMYDIIKLGKEFLPIPDLIIILTASFDTCMARMQKRSLTESDYDVTQKSYALEQDFYHWLEKKQNTEDLFGTAVIRIDTDTLTLEETMAVCDNIVQRYIHS